MANVKGIDKSVTPQKTEVLGESPRGSNSELKKFMEEECRMVKGRFKNYDTPGGSLPFTAGKYPGQPLFKQTFVDGEVYEVPLWVARHLNGVDVTARGLNGNLGSCSYPVHGFKWDPGRPAPSNQVGPSGEPVPLVGVAKRVRRFGFDSLEFGTEVA